MMITRPAHRRCERLAAVAGAVILVTGTLVVVASSASADGTVIGAVVVTGNAASPPAPDRAVVRQLQTAGWTVTAIDDNSLSTAASTEHLADADVVVVASSVNVSLTTYTAALAALPVPVVLLEPYVANDLGLTRRGNVGEAAEQSRIRIVDSTHALAGGLAAGATTVTTSPTKLAWYRPVEGAAIVATLPSSAKAAIFGIDTGTALTSGHAPARRVGFFYTYPTPAVANVNGQALFAAALNWATGRRAPNDDFSDAETISGITGQVSGSTMGATTEPGEPPVARGWWTGRPNSVWYRYTAPGTGKLVVSITADIGGQDDWAPEIFIGPSVDQLEPTTRASAGQDTWVRVTNCLSSWECAPTGASFTLSWELLPPPANDDFANAVGLTGSSGSLTVDHKNSTIEPDEPSFEDRDGSVWYQWTAPDDGILAIDSGTTAWMGDDLSTLRRAGYTRDGWQVSAGTTYHLQSTASSHSQPNLFVLTWTLHPVVANDNFDGAATIAGASGSVAGTNLGGTIEPSEPAGATYCDDENTWWLPEHARTVWYRWQAPTSGHVWFEVTGGEEIEGLTDCVHLFTGDTLAGLADLGTGRPRVVHAEVTAGDVLQVRVSSRCWGQWYCEGSDGGPFELSWQYLATPVPNDDFADAILLTGTSGTLDGHTVEATSEAGEPPTEWGTTPQSVWWRWTAPTDGVLAAPGLEVFTGPGVNQLTRVPPDFTGLWTVQAGQTYQLRAGDTDTVFSADWELVMAPANDDFVAAATIAGDAGSIGAHNLGATTEAGEPDHAGAAAVRSVWWTWLAPRDGVVDFRITDTEFWPHLRVVVYTGAALDTLQPVDDGVVTAGTTYRVVVDSVVDDHFGDRVASRFTLSWSMPIPPANDDFADAATLVGPLGSVEVDNTSATAEPGEPSHDGWLNRSLWWTWTASSDTVLLLDTTAMDFPGMIAVYQGDSLETLVPFSIGWLRLAFLAEAGETYRIAVDVDGWGPGLVRLRWAPGLDNDFAARATPIAGPSGSVIGTNTDATAEDGLGDGNSVWWRWTAPVDGLVTFGTEGSGFDTTLALYRGDPTTGGIMLAANDDWYPFGRASRVDADVVAGEAYWVMVNGYADLHGSIALDWSLEL
jgi:hypothetical protein